jgi:hypothetical protein
MYTNNYIVLAMADLILAIALEGLSPLGQAVAQFIIEWQR